MTMPTLYTIADEFLRDAEKLANLDLDPETIADTLDGLTVEFNAKAVAVAAVAQNMDAFAESIKVAEAKMAERRKAFEKRAESLRDYLLYQMERTGIAAIDSPEFSLKLKKNPPSVSIDPLATLDSKWLTIEVTEKPNKKAIAAALKEGEIIDGATLLQSSRIEIK